MKKKEIDISEFEILDGRRRFNYKKYPGLPIISIASSIVTVSKCAQNILGVTKENRMVFSLKNDIMYIGSLPFDSKLNGYALQTMKSTECLFIHCVSTIKRGLIEGIYKLQDPLYSGGIDWFELEILESKKE